MTPIHDKAVLFPMLNRNSGGGNTAKDESADIASLENLFLGLTEEDARELADSLDLYMSVVKRDGESYAIQMMYMPNRFQVSCENGVVTAIYWRHPQWNMQVFSDKFIVWG
jgi:hypothetical protein